jgi:uncharacterized membrane protein YozB (DUF420 family)
MLAGSALITWYSLPYFDFETLPPFVIEKFPVRFEKLWLFSLRVHVAAASLSFPLCLVLLTQWLKRRPAWHRRLGRVAGVIVVLALIPSGTVLAFDAKGGTVVTVGFLLSAGIVMWGMVSGVIAARRRDLVAHRRAMLHVVAQMGVAVVSRALLVVFDAAGVDPDLAYVLALWVPVPGSALAVEIRTASLSRYSNKIKAIIGRIRHELSSLPLVSPRPVVRVVARPGR